jgi:aspartyl-tRNA(Asn)/glutamyl-tRNA(Gln) amidotransferase subunit B
MPRLPEQRIAHYTGIYQLSSYDATALAEEKAFADYFENIIQHTDNYKAAANWMLGPVRARLNDLGLSIGGFGLPARAIAELISLVDSGKVSFSVASSAIFPELITDPGKNAEQVARDKNLIQDANADLVAGWVDQVLNNMPDKVSEYRKGKKGLIGLFVGEVKKVSKGKADPRMTNELLLKKLQS